MKRSFFVVGIFCIVLSFDAGAQYLKIGDDVPDLEFKHMINYPGGKARLSDFRNKLVIIDLWGKYCSSCIKGFPKMQELQSKFPDKVQVILLTPDSKEDYEKLTLKSSIVKQNKLPVACSDSMARHLLNVRHQLLHVWIGKDGKLIAITNTANTTVDNIEKYLRGESLDHFYNAQVEFPDFNRNSPLLTEGNGRLLNQVQSYSLFITGLKGVSVSSFNTLHEPNKGITGIKYTNVPIQSLYRTTYPSKQKGSSIDVYLEFKGCEQYFQPLNGEENDDFRKNYLFSYELRLSPKELEASEDTRWQYIRQRLRQDLANFFQLEAQFEDRDIKIYQLVNMEDVLKIKANKDNNIHLNERINNRIIIKSMSIGQLINQLERILYTTKSNKTTMINSTGYNGIIDIDFTYAVPTLLSINQALQPFGIQIKEKMERRNVLIIKDKK